MPSRYFHSLAARIRIRLPRWRRQTFFLIGGLTVGAGAVLMAKFADAAQGGFQALLSVSRLLAFVATPLGFGIAAWLARHIFPNSQGSGIPQVIAARKLRDGPQRLRLVSLKVAAGKIVLLMLGLLCGASVGREGPTVQVGAALMFVVGRKALEYQRGLLLAGSAAGIAAAFNTPLAGIVFSIEELSRSFESRTSGLVLSAIIAAGLTSMALVGDYTYFGTTAETFPLGRAWLALPVCAIVGGLAGGFFSRILIFVSLQLPGKSGQIIKRRPILFAMFCGLAVACCGFASHDTIYGTGYEQASAIVHGTMPASDFFAPLKFMATLLSSLSGIPGGLFAPSLAVGAGIAANLHSIFQSIPLGALAVICMVSYLTGVLQTPITSFVIVSEMTQDHAMVIPLMVAALIANGISKSVCREGLYHTLAQPFLKTASRENAHYDDQ
jgi:H+/Cl- antiporter ClcA